ncbi:MAG: hypothetical protein IT320_23095 [Anaerolineae bacterium]|nr:hypothetical protein [Anaerolineae bacterium]
MITDATFANTRSPVDSDPSPLCEPPASDEFPNDGLAWREFALAERQTLAKDEADRADYPQPAVARV